MASARRWLRQWQLPTIQLCWAIVCLPTVAAQLAGSTKEEQPPPIVIAECTLQGGCEAQQRALTLDANWRWSHGQTCQGTGPGAQCSASGNCFTDGVWDRAQCPDPTSCAENCALESVTLDDYSNTYGVSAVPGGVELGFVRGPNVGSRLYVLEKPDEYKLFKLLNREFTFDVDVSTLACGINGALYLSEMEADGGLRHAGNKAGPKYGTGYCDAQCPHDVKFMEGRSNTLEWNTSFSYGKYGQCCAEIDIWEGNSMATAFTMHPCAIEGTYVCEGKECGDNVKKQRYDGVCDKDGCDFNSYRNGRTDFFGLGSNFEVDTTKPMTVVTQFITDDGTDEGDLMEVRRLYVQNGKVIENSHASILGPDGGDAINEAYCAAQKRKFNDTDDFRKKGALKQTGEALRRGMTLVLSLWDDWEYQMLWLDSDAGTGGHSTPGVARGPCEITTGVPADVRAQHPDASVTYYNIMYGEIGSTYTASDDAKPDKVKATGFAAMVSSPGTAAVATGPSPGDAGVTSVSDGASGIIHSVSQTLMQALQKQKEDAIAAAGGWQAPAPAPAQDASAAAGVCVGAYQQCDGSGLSRPRCCQAGCACQNYGDPSYSQCVPPNGAGQCPGAAQEGGLVQKSSLREAAALRADSSAPRWAAPSATALWASAPALLLAIAAAAGLLRARGTQSSAQPHYGPADLAACAE